MGDAALHTLLGELSTVESFAAVMLGEHPLEPSDDARYLARMAAGIAYDRARKRDVTTSDESVRDISPLRAAYLLARDRPPPPRERGAEGKSHAQDRQKDSKRVRVLRALPCLRHRQRAALTLRYITGLDVAEVAAVLAAPPRVAEAVLRAGLQQLVRRAGGSPVDARRSLRGVGASLSRSAAAAPLPKKEPRSVVRLLLAPPAAGAAQPSVAITRMLTHPRPVYRPWPVPEHGRADGPSRTRRSWTRLAAAAAAIIVLLSIALAPRGVRLTKAPLAVVPLAPRVVAPAPRPAAGPVATTYRVRAGDTLWAIAARAFGDPFRWREIWRANAAARMVDGVRFIDPDRIRPGWILKMPAGARRGAG